MTDKFTVLFEDRLLFRIYICITVLMSVTAFLLYGIDKLIAVLNSKTTSRNIRRIPEKTLLTLSFLGGSLGALCGMILFRHKIRKQKFLISVPIFLLLWVILGISTVYL